ncbi:MAG: DNA-3-methyladenine glycosylase I [Candidatus Kapaibacterium sp.]|jgi:DNA-3-methyladenine glycosylase I
MSSSKEIIRCKWVGADPIYVSYHDTEWGVPEHDDQRLFEKIILDGAQAGLSWITILKRREGYRKAFDQFDPEKISRYSDTKIEKLMQDVSIIRNRAKINAAKGNAIAYLALKEEGKTLDEFLWQFVNGKTLQHGRDAKSNLPAATKESEAMSKALRARGFKFVGPTICYAFMQAIGMVNDHTVDCFRHKDLK